ncbi:MAG: PsiF family protein [Burkholderiaceae bacterium]
MKTILASMTILFAFILGNAQAATEQQNKMATCNKEATGKKGEERKAFMKDCLSKKPAEEPKPAMNSQQNKMVTCNKEATGKKGDERKQFMSECLKAK